jgi:hypothetical protein
VVHGPSIKDLVIKVYNHLRQGVSQVPSGSIILLLSIFAFVAYSWTANNDDMNVFSNFEEANAQAMAWIAEAFDELESSQRNSEVSLECVQGLVILASILFNLEGVTSRAYSTLCRAIAMARDLGLHRHDHPQDRASSAITGVRDEVGRRVW